MTPCSCEAFIDSVGRNLNLDVIKMHTDARRTAALCAGVLLGTIPLAALTVSVAGAEPVFDASRQVVTDDGWTLTVSKTGEKLDSGPNLANSPVSRAGVVAVKAAAEAAGAHLPNVVDGTLTLSYQIGWPSMFPVVCDWASAPRSAGTPG